MITGNSLLGLERNRRQNSVWRKDEGTGRLASGVLTIIWHKMRQGEAWARRDGLTAWGIKMAVRVKRHDTEKLHNFSTLLSLQWINHAFNPLLYHIAILLSNIQYQFQAPTVSSAWELFIFTTGVSVVTASRSRTLLQVVHHASVRSPSCPISSPPSFRLLNSNSTKTRWKKFQSTRQPVRNAFHYGGQSGPNYTLWVWNDWNES